MLVRHLLAHTAGLPGWDVRLDGTDLYDWDKVTGLLAEQATWWEPGWKSGYHGISQGNLVGEVVRRIDGRSVGTFFAEEIAGPLGADFHIGLPAEHDHRVALVIPPPTEPTLELGEPVAVDKTSIPYRAANPRLVAEQSWELPWRRAEIPAAGGHGNARGVAMAQSVVSAGGTDARCRAAVEGRHRPHLRRPERRARPGARDRRDVRRRLRPQLAAQPDQPQRAGLLLGWVGRSV